MTNHRIEEEEEDETDDGQIKNSIKYKLVLAQVTRLSDHPT